MKKILISLLIIFIAGIVFAQLYDIPFYTTHYRLRMWTQGQKPSADSLNANTRTIDSLLYKAITAPGGVDTALLLHKYNGYIPMARLRDSVYKISNLDTSRFAWKWNSYTTTNLDTSKVFHTRDTSKYFSIYQLDTSNVAFQNQTNSFSPLQTFNSVTVNGILDVSNATLTGFERNVFVDDKDTILQSGNVVVFLTDITNSRIITLPMASSGQRVTIIDQSKEINNSNKKLFIFGNFIFGSGYDTLVTSGTVRTYYYDGGADIWSTDLSSFRLGRNNIATGNNEFYNARIDTLTTAKRIDSVYLNLSGVMTLGKDSAKYFRVDTLTTENVKSITNFWNLINFFAAVTVNSVFTFSTIPTIASFYQNSGRTIQYYLPASSSDTLATIGTYQTFINKNLQDTTNTLNKMLSIQAASNTMTASTNMWLGNTSASGFLSNEAYQKIFVPFNCVITAVYVTTIASSATDTSTTSTMKIKRSSGTSASDTASYTISTAVKFISFGLRAYNNRFNIPMTAGDTYAIKVEAGALSANPTGVCIRIVIAYK